MLVGLRGASLPQLPSYQRYFASKAIPKKKSKSNEEKLFRKISLDQLQPKIETNPLKYSAQEQAKKILFEQYQKSKGEDISEEMWPEREVEVDLEFPNIDEDGEVHIKKKKEKPPPEDSRWTEKVFFHFFSSTFC